LLVLFPSLLLPLPPPLLLPILSMVVTVVSWQLFFGSCEVSKRVEWCVREE
jgi:hypothetical protein